tara:strand:- start:43 stop:465 length:423 start_codon:yes stop_codon:yes gene_type:complete
MVKNIINSIFIYILLVGCESSLSCEYCYLDIKAPDLVVDSNGYYHMEFLDSYIQTFSTLEAETGIITYNQKVKWESNKEMLIAGHWTNLVNGSSYTDDGGKAYTVLGVWENFIGDTIKVYSGYTDNCNILHIDSLEVVIE